MKTKKTVKVLVAVLMILMLVMMATNVFALTPNGVSANTNTSATTEINTFGGKILGAVTTAGIVLSVIILAVLGIKYMLGSAEEKAEYKKTLMPYLIGAVLIFAASTIANIVYNFIVS